MKKILFPTDFSPVADHAFIYALKLAHQIGASITTLHCYELPALKSSHLPRTTRQIYETMSLEEFANYKDNVPHLRAIAEQTGLTSIPLDHVMKEGEAIFNIIRMAKVDKFDLIVLGTTGASGIKKIFLGSVAAETMENAPCPVLAIPEKAVFDGVIDQVAFTTDYKEEEVRALKWLANWPPMHDANIHCLHVDLKHTDDLTNRMDIFSGNFTGQKNVGFSVVDHTHFEKAIVQFIAEKKIDLLAMVIHKRNFLKELFTYSFTKSLSYHLTTPILAIPESAIHNLSPAIEDRRFGLSV